MASYKVLQFLDLGDGFRAPVQSNLPVLCISGTLDGRTPPDNAVEVLETLPNGKHLIIEGAGHSDPLFLSDPQIAVTMEQFLQGKPIKNKTIQLPPMKFYVAENNPKK